MEWQPLVDLGVDALLTGRMHLPAGFREGETLGNIASVSHVLLAAIVIGGGPLQLVDETSIDLGVKIAIENVGKDFINNGLVLGADVDLKVNPGTGGDLHAGAATIRPGVWLYQLSDQGLVADLTIEGTKYFKDPNLN